MATAIPFAELVGGFRADAVGAPASVLLYGRSRAAVDPVALQLADRLGAGSRVWVEIRDPEEGPDPAEEWVRQALPPDEIFVADRPDDLIPDAAASNLALWAVGAEAAARDAARSLSELVWLPSPLRDLMPEEIDGSPHVAVVARAELLVVRFPGGPVDADRLLRLFKARNVALVATLLTRPLPEYAAPFDFVLRLPGPGTDVPNRAEVVLERAPPSFATRFDMRPWPDLLGPGPVRAQLPGRVSDLALRGRSTA